MPDLVERIAVAVDVDLLILGYVPKHLERLAGFVGERPV
jgi:hypothetical protein